MCRKKHICRSYYERGGESETDFSYALALARRGYAEDEIRKRILSERPNWDNHHGDTRTELYLERTLRRAKQIIGKTPYQPK